MDFTPITKREEILYRELMDAQLEITEKNIEIANLKKGLHPEVRKRKESQENKKEDNFLKDMHEMNKKLIYESVSHPSLKKELNFLNCDLTETEEPF